ncbi:MAG: putative two-component system sensor histidine kinase [Phycisphaerales bacterium]|nr:putative two-component system sensor histidine kinase [Phycisphaerales bacterium]MDB5355114.1 putative two-component system sensor histidine kinase [Phycisphaerales bacterium]
MLTLLVLQGPDKGRRFELPDSPALVGRDSRQLPLTDNTVSRRHCELLPQDGSWVLRDMGSSNGTYVNGARVEKLVVLKVGDQVRVGRTLMVFGAQPGVSRTSRGNVTLAGEEAGMDSAIMATVPSSEDSMVLAVPEPAAAAMGNLKIMYQLGAALGTSFNVDQVLEVVMDLIFEHMQADRGIILLVDPKTNELIPTVVRTREDAEARPVAESADGKPGNEKIHASRTIINHVLRTGEGVLSSNAMADQRFSKGKSVHNLGIRSALCVPIKARKLSDKGGDETTGVIYIDSSVRNYTYAPEQLRLLTAIGLQAGMAIQNAKLYQAQLEAERLAAVGETTAALSHSIKNILQALQGGADVVEMGLRGSNVLQASKGWRIVHRNLDKIYQLTMNLLAYSKQREPQLEMVNPKALVDECLELVAQTANEKGVMVVGDVEEGHPAIPMDPSGMHQVLLNLLGNALDAVQAKEGLVRVECRYDEPNRQAQLEVIDNGAGIAPSMMKHMFELFHSTKGNRGTGLGLAVARKIVEEHEGNISVRSTPGEGTTFTIRLPVYHTNLTDPSQTHGPSAR